MRMAAEKEQLFGKIFWAKKMKYLAAVVRNVVSCEGKPQNVN